MFEAGQNVCFGDVPIHATHTNTPIPSYIFPSLTDSLLSSVIHFFIRFSSQKLLFLLAGLEALVELGLAGYCELSTVKDLPDF